MYSRRIVSVKLTYSQQHNTYILHLLIAYLNSICTLVPLPNLLLIVSLAP